MTAAVREEEAVRMRACLQRLRESDRDIIMLRSYDDLSFCEIGELLGMSENAVTVRFIRALKKLKAEWLALTSEVRP